MNQYTRTMIQKYGIKITALKIGDTERSLRHRAEKYKIKIPNALTIAANVADILPADTSAIDAELDALLAGLQHDEDPNYDPFVIEKDLDKAFNELDKSIKELK